VLVTELTSLHEYAPEVARRPLGASLASELARSFEAGTRRAKSSASRPARSAVVAT
jgi:hypothetical protein